MAKLSRISWPHLVRKLKKFGFEGPYHGGKHPYMVKINLVLIVPNPHKREISLDLLIRILRQANIEKEEWIRVD
ncbi:MAG TPA: type II toxin-antitoxin system HicA family toxin [Thermodesulfobacteriota bacterium]|nr:type II toxin-antitoxin system HicA family toxin [Thermodesulfobacteriota bacterium]